MINLYRNVFKKRSQILALLNDLAAATAKKKGSKKKLYRFIMLHHHIDTFNRAIDMITIDRELTFPDFKKPFHLYIDNSNSSKQYLLENEPLTCDWIYS